MLNITLCWTLHYVIKGVTLTPPLNNTTIHYNMLNITLCWKIHYITPPCWTLHYITLPLNNTTIQHNGKLNNAMKIELCSEHWTLHWTFYWTLNNTSTLFVEHRLHIMLEPSQQSHNILKHILRKQNVQFSIWWSTIQWGYIHQSKLWLNCNHGKRSHIGEKGISAKHKNPECF